MTPFRAAPETTKKRKNKNWRIGGNSNDPENTVPYKKMLSKIIVSNIYFPLQGEHKDEIAKLNSIKMPEKFRSSFIAVNQTAKVKMHEYRDRKDVNVMRMFYEIFQPHTESLFGPLSNRKRFFEIIKLITTRSTYECIFLSSIPRRFDVSNVPWLQEIDELEKFHILLTGLRLLLNIIVIPSFKKTFYPVHVGQQYEIKFVPRITWYTFLQKVTVDLERKNYIIPVTYSENVWRLCRGELQIKPKNGLTDFANVRPYIRVDLRKNCIGKGEKCRIQKTVIKFANSFKGSHRNNFHERWKKFEKLNRHDQVYGIKLDVADCFGNINIDVLKELILSSDRHLSSSVKTLLIDHIDNQYIVFGRYKKNEKIWLWKHGLLQGDIFSAVLCELYMSYLDSKTLSEFLSPSHFLFRKVDDYLFCSKNVQDINKFVGKIETSFVLKHDKSVSNLSVQSNSIEYCGQQINLCDKLKRVTSSFNFDDECEIRHRFKLWNNKSKLSEQGLMAKTFYYPYNNFYFRKTVLNLDYNDLETNFENFYNSMVLVALKFDCCVMALDRRAGVGFKGFFEGFIANNVWYYARKFLKSIRPKGENKEICYGIKIGYLAFETVLKRRNLQVYREILQDIREKQKLIYLPKFDLKPKYRKFPEMFKNISMSRNFRPLIE